MNIYLDYSALISRPADLLPCSSPPLIILTAWAIQYERHSARDHASIF